MPEPARERPSFKKSRARQLLHQAARLADASTLSEGQRERIQRMRDEAERLLQERNKQLRDLDRAVTHPATHHTEATWGAAPGEPLPAFARALRRTLLQFGVPRHMADRFIDSADQGGKGGKGKKGQKGGRKGGK